VIFFLTINLTKTAFASLYINEIYPAPATDEYEWVEFYNQASISADLSDYIFDDDPDFDSDSGNGIKIPLLGILGQNSACYWKLSNYLNNSAIKQHYFKIMVLLSTPLLIPRLKWENHILESQMA
jgi:hypothetical protein